MPDTGWGMADTPGGMRDTGGSMWGYPMGYDPLPRGSASGKVAILNFWALRSTHSVPRQARASQVYFQCNPQISAKFLTRLSKLFKL